MRLHWSAGLLAMALLAAGCDDGADDVLSINATGAANALVFLDGDGDGMLTPGDSPVAGVRVALVRGLGKSESSAVTDERGVVRLTSVPVGSYEVSVDLATVGDSLKVVRVDSARVSVGTTEAPTVRVALGHPTLTTAEARSYLREQRVAVSGVALHGSGLFGDSTVHVADSTGTLRVVQVSPRTPIAAGDSVRLVGRIRAVAGGRAMADPAVYTLARAVAARPPRMVTSVTAARGEGGALDGSLVRVRDARIVSATTTLAGDVRLRVDDGSGGLTVELARAARIVTDLPLIAGAGVIATGVLVPQESGSEWVLRPRSSQDLEIVVPRVSVAAARALAPGQLALLEGVALHGSGLFGDSTVHVADSTGTLRVVQVSPRTPIAGGDSVRLVGRIRVEGGSRSLNEPVVTVLGRGEVPAPRTVRTGAASSAAAGRLDATLVKVEDALIINAQAMNSGDVRLLVDDGSGQLEVRLDAAARISSETQLVPGVRLTAVGVLVPQGNGIDWLLKPRASQDLSPEVPRLTTAGVREGTVGQPVSLVGIAITGWSTFGDGSIHLVDAAGALRVVNVRSPYVFVGDSVRVVGTIGVRDGQAVVQDAVPTVLGKRTPPTPRAVSSATAASADGGRLDAALVKVSRVVVQSVHLSGRDYLLLASDGSGDVVVVIHSSTNISGASYTPGSTLDVTGVLTPLPGRQTWVLKPRSAADVVTR